MRDLDLLATFLAIYRSGSVSAAAQSLGLSQPAVSERLGALEGLRGERLFERTSRGVVPTGAADALAARVAIPLDELSTVAGAPDAEPRGTVRIGGASDVIAARIVPAIAPVIGDRIRVQFTLGLAHDLLEALAQRHLDVVISAVRPNDDRIRSRGLIDEEFVLVGAPRLVDRISVTGLRDDPVATLATVPVVAYDLQPSIVRRYWRSQFGVRPTAPIALVVPDLRAVLAGVIAGSGLSVLPRYLAEPAVLSGQLRVIEHRGERPLNTLYLATGLGEPSTAAAVIMERIRAAAAGWDVF